MSVPWQVTDLLKLIGTVSHTRQPSGPRLWKRDDTESQSNLIRAEPDETCSPRRETMQAKHTEIFIEYESEGKGGTERRKSQRKLVLCTAVGVLVGERKRGKRRRGRKEKNMFTHVLAACTSSVHFRSTSRCRSKSLNVGVTAPVFTNAPGHFPRTVGDSVFSHGLRSRSSLHLDEETRETLAVFRLWSVVHASTCHQIPWIPLVAQNFSEGVFFTLLIRKHGIGEKKKNN